MKTIKFSIAILALAASLGASAETVLIRGATVHTMGEDGTLQNTDILVSGNTIRDMGQNLPVPADIKVFEANGRHITPGMFAGITSIGIGEVSGVEQSMDASNEMEEMRPEFDVSLAYNPNSTVVPVNRVEGITFTMLGAGGAGTIINGRGRMVGLDGGYDSLYGSHVLFVSLGRGASSKTGGSRAAQWMLLQQAFDEAERAPTGTEPALLTRSGRRVMGRTADEGTVVFSVNRAADMLNAMEFARDNGFNAVIYGGAEAWMIAERIAEAGVPVILNPLQNLPSNFDAIGSRLDNAALLEAAGVTVAISGAGAHNGRKQRQLAGNAASYGMTFDGALAALTINPARIFGVERRFGSLEEGKRADLIMWSGDPLEVTSQADLVIVNGVVDSMKSRQTELRDRYLVEDPDVPRAYIKP